LYDFLYAIKNPRKETVELFEKIAEASRIGDKKLKAELKSGLTYFIPCVMTDGEGRSYENIETWTGILIVDVDNLELQHAVELKQYLFDTYPFIIASFLSSSRRGVKCLVRIPICESVEEFKSYFYGLMDEFQHYLGIDTSSKNCALPFYLSYDYDLLYRLDATEWNRKGIQVDEFSVFEGEIEVVENVTEQDIAEIKKILTNMMGKIVDTGHLILRNTSLLCGGFCAGYGLNIDDMRDFMFELIEDTPYLHKSLRTYKTTCMQMLNLGCKSPVYLSKHEREVS